MQLPEVLVDFSDLANPDNQKYDTTIAKLCKS